MVRDVADAMLEGLPYFAMSDHVIPNAWTYMRTIVLTTGLLQTLNEDEVRGVIAHDWATGAPATRWDCGWCGPAPGLSP